MILRGENLIKEYGPKKVVKGVSLEVQQGEIVGLLGPNGAGKTTSFYMIVGLVKPTLGNVFLDDQNITQDAMYKRAQKGIGYLAQEASVFRKLSVEDNILGVLQLTKLSKKEQQKKCDELIEEFHLEHVRKNRGDLLSEVKDVVRKSLVVWRPVRILSFWMSLLPELTRLRWKIFRKL